MNRLKVIAKEMSFVTRERDPDDEWDADDTFTERSIEKIVSVGDDQYADITTTFKVKENQTYFLLYVGYSTGNSFGRSDNCCAEYIDLYQDRELAESMAKRIEDDEEKSEDYGERPNLCLKMNSGADISVQWPWFGYFDQLSEVKVIPIQVDQDSVK